VNLATEFFHFLDLLLSTEFKVLNFEVFQSDGDAICRESSYPSKSSFISSACLSFISYTGLNSNLKSPPKISTPRTKTQSRWVINVSGNGFVYTYGNRLSVAPFSQYSPIQISLLSNKYLKRKLKFLLTQSSGTEICQRFDWHRSGFAFITSLSLTFPPLNNYERIVQIWGLK